MKVFITALAIMAAIMTTAPAGAMVPEEGNIFVRLDRNSDGYIANAESHAHLAVREDLRRFDSDEDGKLDLSEFVALWRGQSSAEKERLIKN